MGLMGRGSGSTKAMAPPHVDYRKSHTAKGVDYDQRFVEHAYRALLWDLEREALDDILPPERCRELDFLDFACGTGRVLRYLMGRVGSATGVDVSASMLAIAARSTGGARLVQGDVTREPLFPSASFDLVTAFRFFARAEAELRSAALVAIHDLLRPDGLFVFNNHVNAANLRSRVKRLLHVGLVEGMAHGEVRALLDDHGFRIERVYPIGLWPGTERAPKVLMPLLRPVERVPAGWRPLAPLANDVIYVCTAL
jgi:SAM-dependent methyltransferase